MYLGIDFGTSGARACVITTAGEVVAEQRLTHPTVAVEALPDSWRTTLIQLVRALPSAVRAQIRALAIDGTSGTVVLCSADLQPVLPPLWYNDNRASEEAQFIAQLAGSSHIAATATSSLAKLLWLTKQTATAKPHCVLHQADWLAAQCSGIAVSDYHNALKLGYDPAIADYPAWLQQLSQAAWLPSVVPPGSEIGPLQPDMAAQLGLPADCMVHAGTTDSLAAFIATGVSQPGDAVTSLGSTLVLKLVSPVRIDQAEYGIYSHKFGEYWLVGGASNSGGAVLAQYFNDAELASLSAQIDPAQPSGLDYYPLPRAGERFPSNNPKLQPRVSPIPENPVTFLHGLLEGIARIEADGYALLERLGAPTLKHVVSAGGGSRNPAFTEIRQRVLGLPVSRARHDEAAYGSARLAMGGEKR